MDYYSQATPSFDTLGRDRRLYAPADFEELLVVDDSGGFIPNNRDLFEIIDSLIREIIRLRDRA